MGAGGAATRHLEVHICTTDDGKVVENANPTMTFDASGAAMPKAVSVATMQGIGESTSDIHYGNNVSVTPGMQYDLVVTLNGAKAEFTLTA